MDNSKKDKKGAAAKNQNGEKKGKEPFDKISTKKDLKLYLTTVRDRMADGSASPVFSLSALNNILNTPTIYALLDNENREIGRDIWLRLRSVGLQLTNPPLLFNADETVIIDSPES